MLLWIWGRDFEDGKYLRCGIRCVLMIGLKYGKIKQGDSKATGKTRALYRKLRREFSKRNGSVNCTELLGYDLDKPEEYERARESGLFGTKCPDIVGDAIENLEKNYLKERGYRRWNNRKKSSRSLIHT
jgi:hypothetical protein